MLTSIKFRNFRNLCDASWEPGPGAHLLLGPNGAGKTSLLESIYLLATTRSFRTPRIEECCRREEGEFSLGGSAESPGRARLELGWGEGGLWRRLNGGSVEGALYLEALPVISWSAADLRVIEGSPRDRRRFLDQGIVGRRPAAIEVLSRYRRALDQKRELLRAGKAARGGGLTAWNELVAGAAAELIARRATWVGELEASLRDTIEDSGLELPAIRLRYRPSPNLEETTAEAILACFEGLRGREIEAGRVLSGPHRDELEISWGGVEISRIASAGEKKLAGILLTASRARILDGLGRRPTVLLDDVDAELDRDRLAAAWSLFSFAPQIVATSCHSAVSGTLSGARIWHLEDGRIRASADSPEAASDDI